VPWLCNRQNVGDWPYHHITNDANVFLCYAMLDLSAIAADLSHFIFSPIVRDLEVILDQELTSAPHIHCLSRDSYYQLHQLHTLVRSLTSDSTATLIHAFVTARLDYCSWLYAGLPVWRLQCLDRSCALPHASRRIPKFGHVSSYMLNIYNFFTLGPRSGLSSRPLLCYHGYSGPLLSLLY